MPWTDVQLYSDANDMWNRWKNLLTNCIDSHVPVVNRRIGKKNSSFITRELMLKMHNRDFLKKKAISTNDYLDWQEFNHLRLTWPEALTVMRKPVGLDKIPNALLKISRDIVGPSLTVIFQPSIRTVIFPSEWKTAKVTPIFRKGERNNLNNYRPISVIPIISKIFEKIIYDKFFTYLNENKLLATCQSALRSLHSTVTALLEAVDYWPVI